MTHERVLVLTEFPSNTFYKSMATAPAFSVEIPFQIVMELCVRHTDPQFVDADRLASEAPGTDSSS